LPPNGCCIRSRPSGASLALPKGPEIFWALRNDHSPRSLIGWYASSEPNRDISHAFKCRVQVGATPTVSWTRAHSQVLCSFHPLFTLPVVTPPPAPPSTTQSPRLIHLIAYAPFHPLVSFAALYLQHLRAGSFSFAIGFCSLPYLHPHLHYNSTLGTAVLLFLSMLPSYPQPCCSATHHSLNPRVKDLRFYHRIIILTAGPGVTGTRCVAVHLLSACPNYYVGLAYTFSSQSLVS
jgi:hypothetical protein